MGYHPMIVHGWGSARCNRPRQPWWIHRNIGRCRWNTQSTDGMVTWISKMIITKNIWWMAILHRIKRSSWLLLWEGFLICQMENSLLSVACPHHVLINPPYRQATDLGRYPYSLVNKCLFLLLVLTTFPTRWVRGQEAPLIPTLTIVLMNLASLVSRNWPSSLLGSLWDRFWQITLQEITR